MFDAFFNSTFFPLFNQGLHWVYVFSPLWVPVFLVFMFWEMWMDYIHAHYLAKQKNVLFEIKLPKVLDKSPAAMESFITSMWQKGTPKNVLETYWIGIVPPSFSLEIVSLGGEIHFYICALAKYKKYLEAQLYAQFPTVEFFEAPSDYTKNLIHDPNRFSMFGIYYSLTKKDPYPIKTYIDYGLDKDPDEEFKVDPLTHVLEFLGSVKPWERVMFQFVFTAHQEEGLMFGHIKKQKTWIEDGEKIVNDLLNKAKDEKTGFSRFATKVETDIIGAIQRHMGKTAFNTYLRGIYISEKDKFDAINITSIISVVKQFSSDSLNGFKPGWFTSLPSDKPWTDFRNVRKNAWEHTMIDHFKKRKWYGVSANHPKIKKMVLTTEELATLFHFPGAVASTPSFTRIPSKKAEAPSNLPV
ncbi:MAG: hypothetical protein WC757_02080 [Candidatus Paceibacterota bacterium]|jgi:hypothetical protein